jgi:hypothetical protein
MDGQVMQGKRRRNGKYPILYRKKRELRFEPGGGDESADEGVVFGAGEGLHAASHVHAGGVDFLEGAGDVFGGEAAREEEGFIRETTDGLGSEGPIAEVTGAAEVAGGVGVEDEGIGGMILEESEAVRIAQGEAADEGKAEGFDGGAEARGFMSVELDGFKEGAVHGGADFIDVCVHKKGDAGGAAGEAGEPGAGFRKGDEAFGLRVKVDADGAGPGFGADGGVSGSG